jgi:hypothetical protein
LKFLNHSKGKEHDTGDFRIVEFAKVQAEFLESIKQLINMKAPKP